MGGKKAELLGVLLLGANETVPLDRIVEGIWGSEPPKSAIRNVRTYAWQVRRELGDEAYRLSHSPGGYKIACAASELDLYIFQQLADEGFRAAKRGETATASEKLEEALSYWRGQPFGGVPLSQYLQAEVDWLQERRLCVLEELLGLHVAQGSHHEVIEKARREIIRHPLRETLHEHLVRSLVRSGRGGEAISAYLKAKQILNAELGVEPAGPLKNLYEEILSDSSCA